MSGTEDLEASSDAPLVPERSETDASVPSVQLIDDSRLASSVEDVTGVSASQEADASMLQQPSNIEAEVKPQPAIVPKEDTFDPQTDAKDANKVPAIKPTSKPRKSGPKRKLNVPEASEEVQRGRQMLIDSRQRTIAEIVDNHDDALRELFHLDKFTSLLQFDPVAAKEDDSEVFVNFKKQFDLFTHAVASPTKSGQPGMRTTRNALSARRDLFAGPTASTSSHTLDMDTAAQASVPKQSRKRKATPPVDPAPPSKGKGKGKPKPVKEESEMEEEEIVLEAPPPVSDRARLSRALRAEKEAQPIILIETPATPVKPKSKTRPSRRKSVTPVIGDSSKEESVKEAESGPEAESDQAKAAPVTKAPKRTVPAKRKREVFRPLLAPLLLKKLYQDPPDAPKPTHPLQMLDEPEYGGLQPFLDSYSALDELPEPRRDLTKRMRHEAKLLNRIDELKKEGRLNSSNPDRKVVGDSNRDQDFGDALVEQAVALAKQYIESRKLRTSNGKRIARGISEYAEHQAGAEERREREQARKLKELARWTAKEVRKKWQMAIDVIRARADAEEMAEQQRLGKIQLDQILEESAQMLATRRQFMVEDEASDTDDSSFDSTPETVVDTEEEDDDEQDMSIDDEEDESGTGGLLDAPFGPPMLDTPSEQPDISVDQVLSPPMPPSRVAHPVENGISHDHAPAHHAAQTSQVIDSNMANELLPTVETAIPHVNGIHTAVKTLSQAVEAPLSDNAPLPASKKVTVAAGADDEYTSEDDEARDADDANFEHEMQQEEQDGQSSDVEMNDLAAEAELPLEELLAKYNYRLPSEPSIEGSPTSIDEAPILSSADISESPVATSSINGDGEFADTPDIEREGQDAEMEADMEAEETSQGSSDAEMGGLAADADVPLEDLLGAYRPGEDVTPEPSEAADIEESLSEENLLSHIGDDGSPADTTRNEIEASDDEAAASDAESTGSQRTIRVTVPFLLRGTLRPYQKAGLDWLASLYVSGLNGILADEMGLGKTIQTISLLGWLAIEKGLWGPHLIVVPTSVMLNWEMEFKKFLPGFKILTYYGNARERKEKRKGWSAENSFHVCITSYQICLADQHMFRRKAWHYMVLDEAHHIKNFRSQRWQTLLGFNTERRLLLTGTPLQNNLMELWSLLYFLMPAHLNGQTGPFANHKDFLDWFSNPMDRAIESGEVMDEETKSTVQRLHTILRPYLLRRLKADVEKQMPAKYEHVVYCRLSKRQRFLYDDFMARAKTRETLASGNFMGVINCLMQLRKVCNHPDLFEVRPVSTSFAMSVPVALAYEPTELIVRKRLLDAGHFARPNLNAMNLVRTGNEDHSVHALKSRCRLEASSSMHLLLTGKDDGDPEDTDISLEDLRTEAGWRKHLQARARTDIEARVARMADVNRQKCAGEAIIGVEIATKLRKLGLRDMYKPGDLVRDTQIGSDTPHLLPSMIKSYSQRADLMADVISRYAFATPNVVAKDLGYLAIPGVTPEELIFATETFIDEDAYLSMFDEEEVGPTDPLQMATTKLSIAFPDRSLLQYDCGKLQKLHDLLQQLVVGGHRALIFTQMTKVLDILETFLSFHGWRYLRLDGSTKVEDRQRLTERFNRDPRILCFISSTRAGGLGINLTGADTVVFYDSDWNPSMDRQCQDRCHRIGQTRDVHIYRFISEATIEENVLKKANQKRLLDNMVIADGEFTTEFFSRVDWRDMLGEQLGEEIGGTRKGPAASSTPLEATTPAPSAQADEEPDMRKAFAEAEDEEDQAAAELAEEEIFVDAPDFSEQAVVANQPDADEGGPVLEETPAPQETVSKSAEPQEEEEKPPNEIDIDADLEGTIDGYMVKFCDRDWDDFMDLDY